MRALAASTIACGLVMLAAPFAQPAATPPAVELTNGVLKATMYLPDVARGYYRSTRFEWGVLASLEFKGHSFYGPWFSAFDPTVGNFEFRAPDIVVGAHNTISGPVEEFSVPLGYDEAKPGGTFVKIGVGHLRKPADSAPYRFSNFYDVVDPGTWTSKSTANSAEVTHLVADTGSGYAYSYTKTTRLVPGAPQMVIEHRLRNTGTRLLESSTYNHNFIVLDKQPTGPAFVVTAPFELTTTRPPDPAYAELRGKQFVYHKELQVGDQVSSRLQGFGATAADYDFRVENTAVGAGVRIRGDRPITSLVLWSIRTTLALEPFVALTVKPGEEFAWTYTFDYYELPK
jgi:hypothetical protein